MAIVENLQVPGDIFQKASDWLQERRDQSRRKALEQQQLVEATVITLGEIDAQLRGLDPYSSEALVLQAKKEEGLHYFTADARAHLEQVWEQQAEAQAVSLENQAATVRI